MLRLAALCALATGCDAVFGLERAPDGAVPDADCSAVTPDEDGDCITDAVDNCPGWANAEQRNGDADGLGDRCDPSDTRGGDRILAFEGFGDVARAMQAWRDAEPGVPEQWVFEPGHVLHTTLADPFSMLARNEPAGAVRLTVEAAFEFSGWGGGPLDGPRIGVYLDTPFGATNGHTCWFSPLDAGTHITVQESEVSQRGSVGTSNLPLLTAGAIGVIRLERRTNEVDGTDDELRCRATLLPDESVDLARVVRGTVAWPADRSVTVFANKSAYKLRWVAIYGAD